MLEGRRARADQVAQNWGPWLSPPGPPDRTGQADDIAEKGRLTKIAHRRDGRRDRGRRIRVLASERSDRTHLWIRQASASGADSASPVGNPRSTHDTARESAHRSRVGIQSLPAKNGRGLAGERRLHARRNSFERRSFRTGSCSARSRAANRRSSSRNHRRARLVEAAGGRGDAPAECEVTRRTQQDRAAPVGSKRPIARPSGSSCRELHARSGSRIGIPRSGARHATTRRSSDCTRPMMS